MEKISSILEQIFEDIFKRNPHLEEEREVVMNIIKGKDNDRN
jgi:hypothetical protein